MPSLLEQVVDENNLKRAFMRARRSTWSPSSYMGRQFLQLWRDWDAEFPKLQQELLEGTYVYRGADAVLIPSGKKKRGVYRASVRDRWVQHAIYRVVKDEVPPTFWSESSYGRPSGGGGEDRSIKTLATRIQEFRSQGDYFVYETDIVEFFPSVKKDLALAKLRDCLTDDSLDHLLEQMISTDISRFIGDADVTRDSRIWDSENGVPQGSVLAPLFANIYLNNFDRWVEDQGWTLFRYIDDILVFCKSEEEVVKASQEIPEKLGELELAVHMVGISKKAAIREPGQSFTFVGISFGSQRLRPADSSVERLLAKAGDLCLNDSTRASSLSELLVRMNNLLEGWLSAYRFCNPPVHFLRGIDRNIASLVGDFGVELGLWKRSGPLQDVNYARSLGLYQLADGIHARATVSVQAVDKDIPGHMDLVSGLDVFTVDPGRMAH